MSQGYASAGVLLDQIWQNWTPTYNNLTVGDGVVVARYRPGKTIHAFFEFTLGSTSAIGTNPQISVPVAAASTYTGNLNVIGEVLILDAGTTFFVGAVRLNDVNTFEPYVFDLEDAGSPAHGRVAILTATLPITWTTDDTLSFSVTYEAA